MKKVPFWLALIIIIVIAFILVVVVILSESSEPRPNNNGVQNGQGSEHNQPLTPQEVFSYVGKIQSIKGNSLVIKAGIDKNYVDKGVLVTVELTPQTQYENMVVPQVLPEGDAESLEGLFKSGASSLADLQVGDEIVVFSDKNVFGQTAITATQIRKMSLSD